MNNNEVLLTALANKEKDFVCSSGNKTIIDFQSLSTLTSTLTDNITITRTELDDYIIIENVQSKKIYQLNGNVSPLEQFSEFNKNIYLFQYKEEILCIGNSTNDSKLTITNIDKTKRVKLPFSGYSFLYCRERDEIVIKTKNDNVAVVSLSSLFENKQTSPIIKEFSLFHNTLISRNNCNLIQLTERFILLYYSSRWSCVSYIIDIELLQCVTSFHIENRRNTLVLFDTEHGIPYFDYRKLTLKNKVLVIINTFSSQCEVYDIKHFNQLKKLINTPELMEIRQIIPNKYWFIISNYYYVYDVEEECYVQKISNLMPNSFIINEKYFVYHSGKGIYKVNINNNFNEQKVLI